MCTSLGADAGAGEQVLVPAFGHLLPHAFVDARELRNEESLLLHAVVVELEAAGRARMIKIC